MNLKQYPWHGISQFPRNTEEVFNFINLFLYKFGGNGIARFSDIPPSDNAPAIAEGDKNLVMHIELSTTGGHVIMATDAPESRVLK
jgi:PhnB protein